MYWQPAKDAPILPPGVSRASRNVRRIKTTAQHGFIRCGDLLPQSFGNENVVCADGGIGFVMGRARPMFALIQIFGAHFLFKGYFFIHVD